MLLKKGSSGPDVRKLQEGLAALGFHPGGADGAFGQKTEDAVEAFQAKVGLLPDGIFGKGSLREWNELLDAKNLPQFKFAAPAPAPDPQVGGATLAWVRVPADPLAGGYDHTILRADAAEAYRGLYAEVKSLGGVISSAGGKRALTSKAGPARSKTSFHYTGRAFDQATGSAMQNPSKDRFLAVREEGTRYFTIWCKTDNLTVPVVTLKTCYCKTLKNAKGQKYTQLFYEEWTGRAFNFTEVAKKHGFQRIPGRRFFFEGGSFDGAEFWHWQWETGMVRGQTTFGSELLRVYSLPECQQFLYWDEVKDLVFGTAWG